MREQDKIGRLLKKLTNSTLQTFPIPRARLEAPTGRGVYVIYGPKGGIEHVGSTPWAKNGLSQRLKDHLAGRSSYTVKCFDGAGEKLRGRYTFRCLEIADGRTRALLEALAIGQLCPRHIGHGHSADVLS